LRERERERYQGYRDLCSSFKKSVQGTGHI